MGWDLRVVLPGVRCTDIDPIVSAAAISAAFVISNYLQRKEDYTEIIQIVIANPHPLVKIQGIAAINRTYFHRHPQSDL